MIKLGNGPEEISVALSDLFIKRRESLLMRLTRIVRNRQTAEDLAQDAYLRVSHALETRTVAHLDAFLLRTAVNLARDHERQQRRRRRYEQAPAEDIETVADAGPGPEAQMLTRERDAALRAAFDALPQRARQAWQLCHGDGLTYADIADRLGVSRNTVYNDIKLVIGHCHDAMHRLERL